MHGKITPILEITFWGFLLFLVFFHIQGCLYKMFKSTSPETSPNAEPLSFKLPTSFTVYAYWLFVLDFLSFKYFYHFLSKV